MAKIVYSFILVFIIEAALILFGGTSVTETIFSQLAQNPDSLENSGLYAFFLNPITLAAAGTAIVAGLILLKNDIAIYAAFATASLTFGVVLTDLWKFTYAHLYEFTGSNTWIFTSLAVVPILIQFGWSVIAIIGNRAD